MNIKEALQVLENAASNGNENVKEIFSSEYKNLRKAFFVNVPKAVLDEFKQVKEAAIDLTMDEAKLINKSVHTHPWHYIGGAALIVGVLGFVFGRSSK